MGILFVAEQYALGGNVVQEIWLLLSIISQHVI
jgi:hypothetical protein